MYVCMYVFPSGIINIAGHVGMHSLCIHVFIAHSDPLYRPMVVLLSTDCGLYYGDPIHLHVNSYLIISIKRLF